MHKIVRFQDKKRNPDPFFLHKINKNNTIKDWNTLCLLFINDAKQFAAVTSVPMQPRGGFPFDMLS